MGISKRLIGDMSSLGHHATGAGSSGWRAPEQLLQGRQTRAVDMFSLGCILFYCITGGRHPFGNHLELDINIAKNIVDLFLVEHIPEVVDLFSHLLDQNAELRFRSLWLVRTTRMTKASGWCEPVRPPPISLLSATILAELKVGNSEDCVPQNGRWNFNNKKLFIPMKIERWAVFNFSVRCDISHLSRELINCGKKKGIFIDRPYTLIKEEPHHRRSSPVSTVCGIMRELLVDFYQTSNGHKPAQIVVFRDGINESQLNQVLNNELDQMIKAYEHLGEVDFPKFTVIVAQKNHNTKLFQANGPENLYPGTVIDAKVMHPRNFDFYMCAHAGMIGTSQPAHYHVLIDEIGFTPNELQNLIHSLSYVYQGSTKAISIMAPVCYAHLAAAQMGQFMKFEGIGGIT